MSSQNPKPLNPLDEVETYLQSSSNLPCAVPEATILHFWGVTDLMLQEAINRGLVMWMIPDAPGFRMIRYAVEGETPGVIAIEDKIPKEEANDGMDKP